MTTDRARVDLVLGWRYERALESAAQGAEAYRYRKDDPR